MTNNITMQLHKGKLSMGQVAKAVALVSAGGLLFGPSSALAMPLGPIGNFIVNGGYGTDATPSLASWTPGGGTGVNARASTDAINTGLGNTGFNPTSATAGTKFFSSAFAILGDSGGATAANQVIASGDTPNSGIFTLTQNFSLASSYNGQLVVGYALDFVFTAVFDGLDSSNINNNDVFSAAVIDLSDNSVTSLISKDSNGLRTSSISTTNTVANPAPQIVLGGAGNPFSIFLAPGNYAFQFTLNETNGTLTNLTNTAVGIDNVSVSGVMLTPEPGLLSLLGIGFGALGWSRRRRSA